MRVETTTPSPKLRALLQSSNDDDTPALVVRLDAGGYLVRRQDGSALSATEALECEARAAALASK